MFQYTMTTEMKTVALDTACPSCQRYKLKRVYVASLGAQSGTISCGRCGYVKRGAQDATEYGPLFRRPLARSYSNA